ncbi:hypothetical protein [Actinophytocola glycyrrhizae]|uniref:Secreted protein n=1 Tax=Actinophytocola glycyrrhizae TaxID=2044873 RepID=A0ABV9S0W8_9PSEU
MTSGSGPSFFGPDVAAWQATAEVVAQPSQPSEPGGRGEDFGKSSPVGLLVLLLFFIAVAFLVRSMTKHLKRVPESFDKPQDGDGGSDEPADGTGDKADEAPAEDKKG